MTYSAVTFEAAAADLALSSSNAATYGLSLVSLNSGTVTVKADAPADGSRCAEIASVAGNTTTIRVPLANANQVGAESVAFKLVTAPASGTVRAVALRFASGYVVNMIWSGSNLVVWDSGANFLNTLYASAVTGTWYRLEIVHNTGSSTTTGTATLNLYALAGSTPLGTVNITGANLHGPDAVTHIECTASNGAVIRVDSLQSNDGATSEIGRYAGPVNTPPSVAISTTGIYQVAGSNVSLSGTATDSDGTVTSCQWQYMDDDENGQFTGSWSNLTTSTTGTGTNSATATATNTSVPMGVRRYRLVATDSNGATGSATTDAAIYAASGVTVPVRYVINTGAYTNAGTAPAASLVAAMNDVTPNSGRGSWAESPAGPAGAILTLVYEPHGPGPVTLTADLQTDVASPQINVVPIVKSLSGATTVYTGDTATPTTTAALVNVQLDSAGNTAATTTIRRELRMDLVATQV